MFCVFFFFFLMIRRPPRSTLFPTRRSSDLRALGPRPHGVARVVHVGDGRQRHGVQHGVDLRPVSDRKSTRLNSSHLVISYAVFCLKKKKTHSKTHLSIINTVTRANPTTKSQ